MLKEKDYEVSKVVDAYMENIGEMAVRPFTTELNRPFLDAGLAGFSHQTIHNWLTGKAFPGDKVRVLFHITKSHPGSWQHKFAKDILAI